MSYAFPPDLRQMIASQMASGRYTNEEEVLRDALHVLQEVDDEAMAIQAAIDDWKSGDEGMPLDEAFEQVRTEYHRRPSA